MSDRIEYLLAEVAVEVPELAPVLARLGMEEATPEQLMASSGGRTHIAMIYKNGTGLISSQLLEEDPKAGKMVLGHEALHLVVERSCRIDVMAGPTWDGDWDRANIAADRWINQLLIDLGICTRSDVDRFGGALPEPGREDWDLMEHWRAERAVKKPKIGTMSGCSPEGPEAAQNAEDVERDQEAHSILAGMASLSPSLRKMVNPPPPKVRWQDVLHEAASAARGSGLSTRPRVTRAKVGRRTTPEIPKAGKLTRKPQLVVVVDVSGSMSGLLDQVVAESDALGSVAAIHLVLHDSQVLFSGQYKKGRDKITPCGGTDFTPAIIEATRVAKAWPGRSVVVHLTDGMPCGDWPDVPSDFSAGYSGIFGGYEINAPGRWRTRRCDPVRKGK